MGYEFAANLKDSITPNVFSRCINILLRTERYVLESAASGIANLQFTGKERRDTWPEDITVWADNSRIIVTIHAGNAQDREQYLRDVVEAFQTGGIALKFEEV